MKIKRIKKMVKGLVNTYIRKRGRAYSESWWDDSFYTTGISDAKTIDYNTSEIVSRYHYNSIENLIIPYIFNNKISLQDATVLDIGSGAGHWIDFYKALGVKNIIGLDVSLNSVNYLKEKYQDDPSITILHGKAAYLLPAYAWKIDIVNAIGVMFHIVNDDEWASTVKKIGRAVKSEGLFIAGGQFGWTPSINLQIQKGQITKRLRSWFKWKGALVGAGFNMKVYRNNAYKKINHSLPENNVLVARKVR